MSKHSSNREQGFTLVELLIAIAVSGLLISALVLGFITTMRGTASAHDRLVASNGNHTLSTYFASDVQSANATMVSTDPTSDSGCATTEASTTNLLRLQWWEQPTLSKMTAFSVSYRTRQVGTTWELVRYACSKSEDPYTPAPQLKDVAEAILATVTPTSHVMVSELYDPSPSSPWPTTATNTGREVTLQAYAALAAEETEPYGYTVSARLRSLSGGTTTTTTSSSTTSTSASSTTTSTSTTTTTTTSPTTATKLGLVSCVRSGASVPCAGPITLARNEWVDISVRLLDASGNAVNATSSVTVNVSSTSNSFDVTAAPVTIAVGSSQSSGPFRVTHTSSGGSATITASATSGSLTPASVATN